MESDKIYYRKIFPLVQEWIKQKKWSVADKHFLYRFPTWMLKRVYSNVSMVIYCNNYIRGKIIYLYIPAEFTIDEIPIIIDVLVEPGSIPEDGVRLSYSQLKQIFTNNKFDG